LLLLNAALQVVWNCDMPLTRTGVRGEVALDIAVQDFGCLTVPIMAKVYKHSDQSAVHGKDMCFTAACKFFMSEFLKLGP
jgi:hypothetical protein